MQRITITFLVTKKLSIKLNADFKQLCIDKIYDLVSVYQKRFLPEDAPKPIALELVSLENYLEMRSRLNEADLSLLSLFGWPLKNINEYCTKMQRSLVKYKNGNCPSNEETWNEYQM